MKPIDSTGLPWWTEKIKPIAITLVGMMKASFVLATVLGVAVTAEMKKPNLLMVVVDDLGW